MQRVFVAIVVFSSCLISLAQVPAPPKQALAIANVTVIDVTSGRALANQTVVVDDRRIASVGDTGTVRVPDAARRIDGLGKFLIPGLIDTHVHLAILRTEMNYVRLGCCWGTGLPAFVMQEREARTRGWWRCAIASRAATFSDRGCTPPVW